jgi:hypothetical protein
MQLSVPVLYAQYTRTVLDRGVRVYLYSVFVRVILSDYAGKPLPPHESVLHLSLPARPAAVRTGGTRRSNGCRCDAPSKSPPSVAG